MLDAPCKHHNGARPSTHTLRQCAITKRIMRGDVPPLRLRLQVQDNRLRLHRCLPPAA